jgi:pyruvate dehydrogenase E2 component (dihydrolipoamide acetyltransferase)
LATPITMPQLGETVVEGTITKWLKQEGDSVGRDEPLFEISTDKVDTEVPSPLEGKLVKILIQEGETVSVGTELAMIDAGGDGQAAAAEEPQGQSEPEQPEAEPAQEETPTGGQQTAPASEETEAPEAPAAPPAAPAAPPAAPAAPTAAPAATAQAAPSAQTAQAAPEPERGPRAGILSPLVRRLAEENKVDLSEVQGSGTGGRITKKDVLAFLQEQGERPEPMPQPQPIPQPEPSPEPMPQPQPQPGPAPQPVPQPQPVPPQVAAREEAIPLTRMRQAIARNMVASMQTSARAWNLVEVNMENIVETRNAAKESFKTREGISLTVTPFVARAVCEALLAFPDVNSELREDQMIRKHYVNLGIAVALDEGLIVPVVRSADTMNLVGLARAINDVATRARSKKLTPDDVQGGTFTITNPGPFGSIISVPIINPPQCAILALDAVEKRPVVVDDAIAIRHMVYISMSWDHRIIDGATAAKFLGRVKQNLETWDFGPEVGLSARG